MVDELPIEPLLGEIVATLGRTANAVLVAPPGAGKTTRVPLALLDAPFRQAGPSGEGRILLLEPRRLAARAAAHRMSALLGETVGTRVGFRTRVERAVSPATRIEAITEGLLLARLLDDPLLDGVAAVLFDEVHERSVDADLALSLCLDLQRTRPELRLLLMSATPDIGALRHLLGPEAPVLASEGRAYPVAIHHAARDLAHPRDLPDAVARTAASALAAGEGDVLCFLPGKAEIARATRALAGVAAAVLPLHGEMPPDAQAAVLQPGAPGTRRIVLATSIAETSLTVPGVRIVVDGGQRRAPRFDAASGLPRLATLPVSRAAADQRAGRAGREAPGTCHRLWTAASHRGRAPFDRPEIGEADLAPLRLALAAWEADWGTTPAALRWIDPPPAGAMGAATALLTELGALDDAGHVTPLGRRMSRLGTHPRLAALLLAARTPPEQALAAILAALLEERDPLGGTEAPPPGADVAARVDAVWRGDAPGAHRGALARIREGAARFRRRLDVGDCPPAGDPAALLAAGFPDRVGQARGEPGRYRLSGGGSASVPPTDPLARSALLVAAGLHLGRSARITLASPLDPADLPASLRARAVSQVERGIDPATGAAWGRERLRLGALVLSDRLLPADADENARALAGAAAASLPTALDWTDAARNLQARVRIARALGDLPDLPDLSDAALAAAADRFLAPAIRRAGATRLADLRKLDVRALLAEALGPAAMGRLNRDLPLHVTLARGRAPVDYTADPPVASARAQSFYGGDATPLLAGGRVPLVLALLSPAGRAAALTRDLPGFWRGGWAETRRELRGRYPRHDWPEHPWRAQIDT